MKKTFFLLLLLLVVSCQVTETIHLKDDGSGTIELTELRDENSYMQLAKEDYTKEEIFKDTTFVVSDYIQKYQETFARGTVEDKNAFSKYAGVKIHIKKDSFQKEFRTTITQNFKTASDVVDLYKAENYADDIKYNYSLAAEEHYYKVRYTYTVNHFNRIVSISDSILLKKEFDRIEKYKTQFKGFQLVQSYVLNYHFPRKIVSISNPSAKISDDRKSLSIQFLLSDCLQNPEITNLEVVLESVN